MTEITRKKYPISPTLKLVDEQGRATSQFQRLLRAISELVEAVSIEDGEITTDMLEAEIIRVSTLFADEVIITGKVAQNAISELTAILQTVPAGPSGDTILSGTVPISTTNNTGLLLTLTAFMDLPTPNPGNFGYWQMHLQRNGVTIGSTPGLYYDDNFSYQPVATFIDSDPGTNPTYSVITSLSGGLGNFTITGGVLNVGLLKR